MASSKSVRHYIRKEGEHLAMSQDETDIWALNPIIEEQTKQYQTTDLDASGSRQFKSPDAQAVSYSLPITDCY
jgi:hypothetical protein